MFKLNKKGQNTAEYALVIGLVVAAAMAMQTYVSRSLQSGVKYTANKLVAEDQQYEPYYLRSHNTSTTQAHTDTEQVLAGGEIQTTRGTATTTRSGSEIIRDDSYATP